ncbi:MAG TPA: HsdR family type I site-specific deoxyribonuclease [Nevskiaceae bacterium]|nr:HsdR family type I site-specific deoxyribonuclease [Nevskiaceae bacterium]
MAVSARRSDLARRRTARARDVPRSGTGQPPGSALRRQNPSLLATAISDAVAAVQRVSGQSLVDTNRDLYSWMRDGIPVEVERDGHKRGIAVQVFDWDDPEGNDWLIVNQFTVKGTKTDRPDLVAFVNGLPLAVIELKNPADEKTDVWQAYSQIQNYQTEIPQLFEPGLCAVISDGAVARVGSLTASQERYMPWRIADGIDDTTQHLELEVLVRGLFAKDRFLEYFHHFVAYQTGGAGTAKIIAGYHQFHGVLKAVARAVDVATHRHDGKGGVVWFTQGSGKSLLALYYAAMLCQRPELENPTIIVVTDRNNLDGQLFETFANCLIPLGTEPQQADDRAQLRKLLREQSAGGVFFTTIQTFAPQSPDAPMEALCERSNVVVICAEAHRTQYGFKARMDRSRGQIRYGLARYMHDALPNAIYLGMTGTPVSGDERDTEAVFGDYVDIYDVHEMGDTTIRTLAHELTEKLGKSATIDWQLRGTVICWCPA